MATSVSLQARYHLCSAGWLEGGRVAYPTAYASQNCGSGVVGIIDYGTRNNKSEMWDVFCYRMKGNCPSYTADSRPGSGSAILSRASQSPRVSRSRAGPCLTGVGPHVLLPSRCELHLQGGLRGRWPLVQRESVAGPDVFPLTQKLPDGTYPLCMFSPQRRRACFKAVISEVSP